LVPKAHQAVQVDQVELDFKGLGLLTHHPLQVQAMAGQRNVMSDHHPTTISLPEKFYLI
jgi:hypothetical protein